MIHTITLHEYKTNQVILIDGIITQVTSSSIEHFSFIEWIDGNGTKRSATVKESLEQIGELTNIPFNQFPNKK